MKPTKSPTAAPALSRRRTVAGLMLVSAASVCLMILLIAQATEAAKEQHHIKQTIKSQVPKLSKESQQKAVAPIERRASNADQADQAKQAVADKKQGDQIDALFNTDEYVQIKPEEITVNEQSKDAADPVALSLVDLPSAPAASSSAASSASSSSSGQQQQQQQPQQAAEHKSADDELNAHLAQDTISTLESANRQYAAPTPQVADQRAARPQYQPARGAYMQPAPSRPAGYPAPGPRYGAGPRPYGPAAPMGGEYRGQRSPGPYGGGPRGMGPPPPSAGYMSHKARPMSSMVPHPHPHQPRPYGASTPMHAPPGSYGPGSSRYLPRGAAAGYAAFRDFVRSQASRYKQQGGAPEPVLYNAAPPSGPSYGASAGQSHMPPPPPPPPAPSAPNSKGYGQAAAPPPAPAAPAYEPAQQVKIAPSSDLYGAQRPAPAPPATDSAYAGPAPPHAPKGSKTKVTVAQAYIPHLNPQQASGAYGNQAESAASGQSAYATNPVLAKLYGGHAPQGVGRPEYSKDYGMVIHYPQATVYTEPMTVDQLHKLAGSSIGQILEHLQHNLASGQRDESNTLRPNNKHHLGHGLTIHAKEYYAPGKGGQYVPTTAAVISSAGSAGGYGSTDMAAAGPSEAPQGYGSQPGSVGGSYAGEQAAMSSHPAAEAASYGLKPELGSGYERVKAAAAASSTRYNPAKQAEFAYQSAGPTYGPQQGGNSYRYEQQQQPQQQPSKSAYEPLGTIASIIGSELESLYNKANSVLAKQIDPEIHAHVQAHLKSLTKMSPLKMTEHSYKSPLVLRPIGGHEGARGPAGPPAPRPYGPAGGYPRPPPQAQHHMRGRGPRRPSYPPPPPHYARQPNGNRHPAGPYGRPPAGQPQGYHPGQQQAQSANYMAEQQAVQQQMAQLLHDFQLGDEQYSPKGQSAQTASQGYPNKLMNSKYQQQSHHQQQQLQYQMGASAMSYEQNGGLELPQGPNDQIGEISELIEALKGTLEAHKPEGAGYQQQTPSQVRDHGKLEDVRYLASALGQVPTYAIQVPVSQPQQQQQQSYQSGESSVNEAMKKSQQQSGGYQQEAAYQPQQAQPNYGGLAQSEQAAYQSHEAAYGAVQQQGAPAAGSYGPAGAPAPQGGYSQQASGQQAPQAYAGQPQEAQMNQYGPGQAGAPAAGYGAPAQQVDSYGQQPAEMPAGYANPATSLQVAAPAASHAPQQQQQQQAYSSQQQAQPQAADQPTGQPQQQPYSSSEHTQVINHLVPVQQSQSTDYSGSQAQQQQQQQQLEAITSSVAHQPNNQISVAAPSDSQYQSAQSLSSFVDSLPSDYQELLRQPAGHASLLDSGAASVHESVYSNASAATTATATATANNNNVPSSSASESVAEISKISQSSSQASSPISSSSSHQHQNQSQEPLISSASSARAMYQQQQPLARAKATSTSSVSSSAVASSSGQQQQQADKDKKKKKK